MSRFEDRRPIRRHPKSMTVRIGIFRIVRGRDDWVILGRHGKFMGTKPLLQEAEDWARDETSRLAEVQVARLAQPMRDQLADEAFAESDMPKGADADDPDVWAEPTAEDLDEIEIEANTQRLHDDQREPVTG